MEVFPACLQVVIDAAPDREVAAARLLEALTHRTFINEHPMVRQVDNQRLELLGDAVLEFVVTRALFDALPGADEGLLSRARASVVNEAALSAAARALDLGPALRLGRGEAASGGRERARILADALEAVIAAIYLAVGIEVAQSFVLGAVGESIAEVVREAQALPAQDRGGVDARAKDPKSVLQELIQREGGEPPTYELESTLGPVHDRVFRVRVEARGVSLGSGEGRSRREAEMRAASVALSAVALDPSIIAGTR